MIVIDNKFEIGEVVYLLTDDENLKRIVTSITIHSGNYITYDLSCGAGMSIHSEMEINKNKTLHI